MLGLVAIVIVETFITFMITVNVIDPFVIPEFASFALKLKR